MKSSLRNMILSLTGLTIFAGGALAAVNLLTAEPIAESQSRILADAMQAVLPPFDNDIASGAVSTPEGLTLYPATFNGSPAGMAVETYSDNGFSGRFNIIVGFDAEGAVTGYRVLSHSETPGLGAKMDTWFCSEGTSHDIKGTGDMLAVRADGGDIDAITGATITSRAFLEAVNKAREAFNNYKTEQK